MLLAACTKDVGKVNFGNYPDDIGGIIGTKCAISGCHNTQSNEAASSFNMQTWQSIFAGSTNGSPIIPYNSKFSSLCYFINTYSDLGTQNAPIMPLNGQPLSHDEVKRIQNWIDNGAPDVNGTVWASSPSLKKLYAVNQGCDVVTVFDSDTKLPVRTIKVGTKAGSNTPHQVRVSPDGQYWYVIFINNNVMQKFRCSDDSYIGAIPLTPAAAGTGVADAQDWNTLVISKDSKRAYCVSWTQNGKISSVDLENMKLIHHYGGWSFPHGICLNATEDKMYVAAQTGNYVTEIDTGFQAYHNYSLQNGQPWTAAESIDPHDLILAPDNENLIVTCQNSNDVRVFNIATHSVIAIIPTGIFPQDIVYAKSTNQYFVSCTEDSTTFPGFHGVISCIQASGYTVKPIKCGFQPHGIAVDEYKKLVYVLSRNISVSGPLPHHTSLCTGKNGFVNFIDLNTLAVLPNQYELSVDPYFIFARP
jgi:YVTN family beta-propeller protein